MSRSFNGSSQNITSAFAVDVPFTVSLWYFPASVAVQQVLWWAGSTNHNFYLIYRGASAGKPMGATQLTTTGGESQINPGISSANQWYHITGVFKNNSSRTIYLDAVAGTENTVTASATTVTNQIIGSFHSSSNWTNGNLAEQAVWNVELSPVEIASLASGVSPLRLRPSALIAYAPLVRDIFDYREKKTFTNNGSTEGDTHPRVYR